LKIKCFSIIENKTSEFFKITDPEKSGCEHQPTNDDDDVYLDKLQTRGVEKSTLYI
jgi:hypothetical protein